MISASRTLKLLVQLTKTERRVVGKRVSRKRGWRELFHSIRVSKYYLIFNCVYIILTILKIKLK